MQEQNNSNSQEATLQALMLVDKIDRPDDLKALFAALVGLIVDRPNGTASEYLDAMSKAAVKRGMIN